VSGSLEFRNRQRARKINPRRLKAIIRSFLEAPNKAADHGLPFHHYGLAIHLVDSPEIQNLNETWLRHKGPTDVITFDYSDPAQPHRLGGEIFICIPEAIAQANQFDTTWQSEVVRYIVHGILHLSGFDDQTRGQQRKMKRVEDHWMKILSAEFDLRKISSGKGV